MTYVWRKNCDAREHHPNREEWGAWLQDFKKQVASRGWNITCEYIEATSQDISQEAANGQ